MSDEIPMQQDIFGGETPMVTETAEPLTVLRRPGWYLVSTNSQGPRWWHVLMTGARGQVVTRCGLRGHVVGESQREITCCPDCDAQTPQ